MENNLQTTSWNNTAVYKSFHDPKIKADLEKSTQTIHALGSKVKIFEELTPQIKNKPVAELNETLGLARDVFRSLLDTEIVLNTMYVYANSAISVDSQNAAAKDLYSQASQLRTEMLKVQKPLEIFLIRAPAEYLENFLQDSRVSELSFHLKYGKTREDFLLNVESEVLQEGLGLDGLHAWGRLYQEISGTLKVKVNNDEMGLAQAANLLFQGDRDLRKHAYRGIDAAWAQNEIPVAAILNSINGWRLESNRARSQKRELHYLENSCFVSRISTQTLDTLMQVTREQRKTGQKALKLMAQSMGIEKLAPWDILAAYPSDTPDEKISFPDAMEMIIQAFAVQSADMADFARIAWQKNWIDATPTPNRGNGAYCTRLISLREPRVFMTYEGSMKNVITLAHELGHAYHNWVMRDMPLSETHYSMTLAETASIFAETLVREAVLRRSNSNEEKKKILWQDLEAAGNLLINIPARFEMEKRIVELRKNKTLTPSEFKQITRDSWEMWYEDTLSEYNEMYWASKLHFSMSKTSFYNYPYLFGYLFSLGIYAQKDKYGDKFKELYVHVLRDTGTMTAEDLIKKHFRQDITQPEFWLNSFKVVEKSVAEYEKLV